MTWRTISRAGYFGRNRDQRRRELDRRYGPDGWRVRHEVNGAILGFADAARLCEDAYVEFLPRQPVLLDWLCLTAKDVFCSSPSNVRSGLDYNLQERKLTHIQDIAVRNAVKRLGRSFQGECLVQLGKGCPEAIRLGWGHVPFHRPEWIAVPALKNWWDPDSVVCFWESNKVIQVRVEEDPIKDGRHGA